MNQNSQGRATPSRTATIRDVAELAGVSSGTVSNVLNRPFYVKDATRERVLTAIEQLNFQPQQAARQFRPGRVRTIGISVANLDNPFFVDVALGAEDVARKSDVGVVITNSAYDARIEDQNLDLLVQQRVQGLIISPVDESSSRLQMLHDRGVPMVFVDRVGARANEGWSVVVDDKKGGALAARHLLATGHRNISFIGHPHASPKVHARLTGVLEVLDESPEVSFGVVETTSWTIETGREAGNRIAAMKQTERPTGVMFANDLMALGALQTLSSHDLRIPEDIAVIGYDDLEWAAVSSPALTTVRQPRRLLGATAVRMVLELFREGTPKPKNNHIVLEPDLVVRDTT